MDNVNVEKQMRDVAEAARRACAEAAEAAYEDAGIRGLCAEGRWEIALEAIRRVDLEAVIREVAAGARSESSSARTDPSHQ
ncbi:MAG TPA: hypothetical protein VGB24_17515 [Longimicrobium sp.]|uniref:hypothetical protein n=1 Tax=Longimicrobium sp. TaxID=2029185 RepID=UPI002EDA989C